MYAAQLPGTEEDGRLRQRTPLLPRLLPQVARSQAAERQIRRDHRLSHVPRARPVREGAGRRRRVGGAGVPLPARARDHRRRLPLDRALRRPARPRPLLRRPAAAAAGPPAGCSQWRQRQFKYGRDEPCGPTVRLPD